MKIFSIYLIYITNIIVLIYIANIKGILRIHYNQILILNILYLLEYRYLIFYLIFYYRRWYPLLFTSKNKILYHPFYQNCINV